MTDNVFITGAAEGAFADALDGLPPWATQATAAKIEMYLRKSLDIQTKSLSNLVKAALGKGSGGPGSSATMAGMNTEVDKLVKGLRNQNAESDKSARKRKEKDKIDTDALFGIQRFKTGTEKAQFALAGIVSMGAKVLSSEQQYLKTYDALYKSGVNVFNGSNDLSDGFTALQQVVVLTGLRLETLQAVAERYSSSINAIGFNKFAKATGLATANMKMMGYTAAETAELIGVYTDQQSHYTDMRRKSENEIALGVQIFGRQIKDTSVALGVSRQDLIANSKAMSESTDLTVIAAQYGEAGAKNVNAVLMGMKPEAASKFLALVADSGAGLGIMNSSVNSMLESTSSFTTEMMQMGKDLPTMELTEFNKKWGNIVHSPAFADDMKRMQLFALSGSEHAKTTQALMSGMLNYSNRVSESTKGQADAATTTQGVISGFRTEQERMAATMQALFSPLQTQIEILTGSMKLLNDVTYGLAENTNAATRSWVGAGSVITGFLVGTLIPMMGKIGSMFGVFGGKSGAAGSVSKVASAGGGAANVAGGSLMGILSTIAAPLLAINAMAFGTSKEQDAVLQRMIDKENAAKRSSMSVPKSPAQSTINSPSAGPIVESTSPTSMATESTVAAKTIAAKAAMNDDINTSLSMQTHVLERILDATKTLVSVNQDILRRARSA